MGLLPGNPKANRFPGFRDPRNTPITARAKIKLRFQIERTVHFAVIANETAIEAVQIMQSRIARNVIANNSVIFELSRILGEECAREREIERVRVGQS